MATERQIAANRRNARRSTGPRSTAGKRRVSRNAYRHGFSASVRSWKPEDQQQIEMLTKQFAGDATDPVTLDYAHTAAEAHVQLGLIRRAQLALIEQIRTFGVFETQEVMSQREALRHIRSFQETGDFATVGMEATLPKREPGRTAEAVRRALSELRKLDRFVRRAFASRNQALMQLTRSTVPVNSTVSSSNLSSAHAPDPNGVNTTAIAANE